MKIKNHDITIIDWASYKPWPDRISYDGIVLDYAHEWENSPSGKQLISYRHGDEPRRYRIDRKDLLKVRNHDMKQYKVKPEYLDRWTNEAIDELIVTDAEIRDLAKGWDVPVEELMKQVEDV